MGRDIAVGQSASFSKTITEWDVYTFAGLSGDLNPAHINEEYAKTTRFGGRIAHGMLSAGLISAVIGMQLPGPGTIYLGQELSFRAPVRIGDTVTIRKAGEIIPEILAVVPEKRPQDAVPFRLPSVCPVCGAPVERDPDGAAVRCTGAECPAQLSRNIAHFVSRGAMDIEGLGEAIVDQLIAGGHIHSPADIYYLKLDDLKSLWKSGTRAAQKLLHFSSTPQTVLAALLCLANLERSNIINVIEGVRYGLSPEQISAFLKY